MCFLPSINHSLGHLFSAIYSGPITPFVTSKGPPCTTTLVFFWLLSSSKNSGYNSIYNDRRGPPGNKMIDQLHQGASKRKRLFLCLFFTPNLNQPDFHEGNFTISFQSKKGTAIRKGKLVKVCKGHIVYKSNYMNCAIKTMFLLNWKVLFVFCFSITQLMPSESSVSWLHLV